MIKKKSELVSVIIPCYNQGLYVLDAIHSVQDQTYKNWEIIIVNDGSTDSNTQNILKSLEINHVKVIHTANQGLPAARNLGIVNAIGNYILPLDADDKIAPSYIEKAINKFQLNNALKLVYCRGRYFGDRKDAIPFNSSPFLLRDLLLYNFIFCSAVFKKKDFESAGGYSLNMNGGWEDWDLWIRLLEKGGEVYQIPEELFYYRIKEVSMIEDLKENSRLQDELRLRIFLNNIDVYVREFGSIIDILRELQQLKNEQFGWEKVKQSIYQSASYRLGHALLSPVKWLKRFINR
jgi:glycosyltransferase involved in cell wall biosynthesis